MSFGNAPRFLALALTASICGLTSNAAAHFSLESPPSATEQDGQGNPQKAPPCGDNGASVPTNVITTYQAGQKITVTIDEKIFHPGHYRIALALNDQSELPAEPPVTAGNTACGSTTIMDPPVFPVLADGVFAHTAAFSGPQTIEITLPDDVTCDHCTLQVIEFMSQHGLNNPGGCFYHHCAEIAIQAEPVMTTATVTTGSTDATTSSSATTSGGTGGAPGTGGGNTTEDGDGSSDDGCGCTVAGQSGGTSMAALAAVAGLALFAGRRRRR